jgi:porin
MPLKIFRIPSVIPFGLWAWEACMGTWTRFLIGTSFLFVAAFAQAQDNETAEESATLLPDWGRTALAEKGYKMDFLAVNDYWANVSGGVERTDNVIGNLFLTFEVDTEKAGFWDGGKFLFAGIGVYGRGPFRAVGDYQFTDSIDAPGTFEVWQLYYSQDFADGDFNLLAGIHDFSMEFSVLSYGWSFINSSFWTPPTITQNTLSFYPFTGLGIRGRGQVTDELYVLGGMYDGTPSNPARQRELDWGLSRDDGLFAIAEVGYETAEGAPSHTKIALGAWHSSARYEDITGETRTSNYGSYVLAQQDLTRECDDCDQGLAVFGQIGQANTQTNLNSWYFGAGLRYKGLLPNRDDDVVGVGWAMAQTGGKAREVDPSVLRNEQAFEVSYRAQITPYFWLTPDVQYVRNPGPTEGRSDAVVLFMRTELAL